MSDTASPKYEQDGNTYADCGVCASREWCPLFIINIKSRVKRLLEQNNDNVQSAFNKALLLRNISKSYPDGGVVSYLRALKDKTLVPDISPEDGKNYLLHKLQEEHVVRGVQMSIVMEESMSA